LNFPADICELLRSSISDKKPHALQGRLSRSSRKGLLYMQMFMILSKFNTSRARFERILTRQDPPLHVTRK
jgi:hypothetical protein